MKIDNMNTERIKLLTWKVNQLNMKIQARIVELDKLITEREGVENELGKLNNPGYYSQNNEKNN
jgi:hypothetical protein